MRSSSLVVESVPVLASLLSVYTPMTKGVIRAVINVEQNMAQSFLGERIMFCQQLESMLKNLLQTDTVPAMLPATFMNLPQTLLASGSVAAMAGLSLRLAIAVPPGI